MIFADILKISEEELEFITGMKDLERGSQYIYERSQTKLILVTLGADGCLPSIEEIRALMKKNNT